MPRVALLLLCLVVLVAAGTQLLLPTVLEGRVADRLERGGGSAHVSLHALPAARLLFDHGDSLKVEGRDLRLQLRGRGELLDRLDGFDQVRVRIDRATAPPLAVRSFSLTRPEEGRAYAVRLTGTTSPRDVARFLGSRAAGGLGGLAGDLAAGALPSGGRSRIPLAVAATVRSRDGHRQVTSSRGTVAGVPAGPLVGLVMDAVVREL
jgi:hypothetical protein